MDTDFHFFGTASAALSSGFSEQDATLIANAAEYVDFFNSDYWSYWSIQDNQQQEQVKIDFPHLSCQFIDWKMIGDYDDHLWNAFHFPPGNRGHNEQSQLSDFYIAKASLPYWVNDFKSLHKVRDTNLSPSLKPLLCRPYSPFALHMCLDTIATFKKLSKAKPEALTDLLAHWVDGAPFVAPKEARNLALIFLGMRMHVLADTWAHQDFSGIASKDINSVGTFNYIFASKDESSILESTQWTGSLWALAEDTDCAVAPNVPGHAACRGHGQLGHYPDYSWLTFIYPAAWLKEGGYLVRNNPSEYEQAWYWLRTVMHSCLASDPAQTEAKPNRHELVPQSIRECIRTPHQLDSTQLFAVAESEQLWRKLATANRIQEHKRWNNAVGKFDERQRKHLGVIDGLPATRYGTLNVAQDSPLHLMELAATMHYQWCVRWAKAHPEFQWQPLPKHAQDT